MQTDNRLFEDVVKTLNGLAGTMAGMGREAEANARERMRDWLGGGAQTVGRDEFEAVKAMAAAARDEADALRARLDALEAKAGTAIPADAGRPAAPASEAGAAAPGGDAPIGPGTPSF